MSEQAYSEILKTVTGGTNLTRQQATDAFSQIMDGRWSEAQIAGLLTALATKGETFEEIAGAAEAMRQRVVQVDTGGRDVIDIVGTGGTGLRTFNVSTTTSMVVAGAGAAVAKHGNRTNTRASGSANVLEALGVNLDIAPEVESRCLAEAGVCFCYAIKHHPAMKYAAPVRKQLGIRTIFNVLGPLTNPAGAKRYLMGTFKPELTEPLARALAALDATRAMVVRGEDGMDEVSITEPTQVTELRYGEVSTYLIQPEDFDLPRAMMQDLLIETPEESAKVVRAVLDGQRGAPRNAVVLNAAAALVISEKAPDISTGVKLAEQSIDEGKARAALDKLIEVSNG